MSVSTVQIANFALSKIGDESTIESLTEESAQAKQCNLWYAFARRKTLAAFSWSFARKRATLALHNDDPPTEWAYRYRYPDDCVSARLLENPSGRDADPVPFEVEQSDDGTRSFFFNDTATTEIYTKEETNTTRYSDWFVECFATMLASHIALPLSGKPNFARYLEDRAILMARFAEALDANEGSDAPPRDADHIRGRE